MDVSGTRIAERHQIDIETTVSLDSWRQSFCRIIDLSSTGFLVYNAGHLTVGTQIAIALPNIGVRRCVVVRKAGWRKYGCELVAPLSTPQVAALLNTREAVMVRIAVLSNHRPAALAFSS